MARTQSGNQIIVEGAERGAVFPASRQEVYKELVIDGRTAAFSIGGGAFSPNLQILGAGTIRGPVFASENLRMENDGSLGPQRLLSGASAYQSIITNPLQSVDVEESPAARLGGISFIVRGDIQSMAKVRLRNTLVVGSVKAPDIHIQNCIVLGTVNAGGDLGLFTSVCSTFGLYKANQIVMSGPTSIIAAGGMSVNPPMFEDYQAENGRVFPFSIRYLPLCRNSETGCEMGLKPPLKRADGLPDDSMGVGESSPDESVSGNNPASDDGDPSSSDHSRNSRFGSQGICCAYWLKQECSYQRDISLRPCDFIQLFVKKESQAGGMKYFVSGEPTPQERGDNPSDKDPATETVHDGMVPHYFFGIQNRAIQLEKLVNSEAQFQRILHGIFSFEHISPEDRETEKQSWESLSAEERRLMELATDGLESYT